MWRISPTVKNATVAKEQHRIILKEATLLPAFRRRVGMPAVALATLMNVQVEGTCEVEVVGVEIVIFPSKAFFCFLPIIFLPQFLRELGRNVDVIENITASFWIVL